MNPDTGQVETTGDGSVTTTDVTGTVTEVAAYRSTDLKSTLAPVVALEVLALLAVPPAVYFFWIRRRRDAA